MKNHLTLLIILFVLAGCSGLQKKATFGWQNSIKDFQYSKTDDGWKAENENYVIIFISNPTILIAHQPVEFKLKIFDKVHNTPVSMDDTVIECTSFMPNTPGYVRVLELNKQIPGQTPGVCSLLPLSFDTPGSWSVVYAVALKSVENFRINFPVIVQ